MADHVMAMAVINNYRSALTIRTMCPLNARASIATLLEMFYKSLMQET